MQRKSRVRFIGTSLLLAGALALLFSRPVIRGQPLGRKLLSQHRADHAGREDRPFL